MGGRDGEGRRWVGEVSGIEVGGSDGYVGLEGSSRESANKVLMEQL